MSVDLFYAMQAEAVAPGAVPPLDLYLVIAFNATDKRWSVRHKTCMQEYLTLEAAQANAQKLSTVWRHVKIFRITDQNAQQ